MVSLLDDGALSVTVEDVRGDTRARFAFVFGRCFGYRNVLEEYRTLDWPNETTTGGLGWTRVVQDSGWIAELQREPLFELHGGRSAVHYVILTEDDVIEVLSMDPPRVHALGPTPPDAPRAGKSRVLLHPDEREQIEELIDVTKPRRP